MQWLLILSRKYSYIICDYIFVTAMYIREYYKSWSPSLTDRPMWPRPKLPKFCLIFISITTCHNRWLKLLNIYIWLRDYLASYIYMASKWVHTICILQILLTFLFGLCVWISPFILQQYFEECLHGHKIIFFWQATR